LLEEAKNSKEASSSYGKNAEESKDEIEIFVGNLPFRASENEIIEFFSDYGDVASVKILQRVTSVFSYARIGWKTIRKRIREI
jgi:RNA recognition motif-containing protein